MQHDRPPGAKMIKTGLALLALPLVLFLVMWQSTGRFEDAGMIASWPAFLMWPIGGLFVGAGFLGRFIRHLDTRSDQ